jgi:hypothetical protein
VALDGFSSWLTPVAKISDMAPVARRSAQPMEMEIERCEKTALSANTLFAESARIFVAASRALQP